MGYLTLSNLGFLARFEVVGFCRGNDNYRVSLFAAEPQGAGWFQDAGLVKEGGFRGFRGLGV